MPTKTKNNQLRFSRIDFFRLRGHEFFDALFRRIDRELGEGDQRTKRWPKLNRQQQGVFAWWTFIGEVENGGLAQFFYNCGDLFVPPLDSLFKDTGNEKMSALLKDATTIYRKHKKEFQVEQPFGEDGLFARMTELSKLDRSVLQIAGRMSKPLEKWLRANFVKLALGDDGKPIDPTFSGEIETFHSNGKVFEQATIRRGVVTGQYRRYLDDGTLEHTCFYQGGEVSSNYWPNGQPKQKTMKRGKLKFIEWFYPSGQIQKRYVEDKTGHAVEPVRFWYENGQLAEEVHVKEGEKRGPWLKFFEDGSPRLQAEYRKGEKLIVKNAWDDQRQQIVKNGTGIFHDDGADIDWSYKLFFQSNWTSSSELQNGIRHGVTTEWHDGVLWGTDHYSNGKPDGLHTCYYDNGRIRLQTTFRSGKEIKTEKFSKFDNPKPVVLMEVEANARLFEAWRLPLLDVYPTPTNLAKLQKELTIPTFLQDVFDRNLSHELKDDYEDINTFKDGISYFVTVTEKGTVSDVKFSGCSVYSSPVVNDYPPIIRQLKFRPGKLNRHSMSCRVLVRIEHTFTEADTRA